GLCRWIDTQLRHERLQAQILPDIRGEPRPGRLHDCAGQEPFNTEVNMTINSQVSDLLIVYLVSCRLAGPYSISSIRLPSGSATHACRELSMPIVISVTLTPLLFKVWQYSSRPVTSRQKCLYCVPAVNSCTFPPHTSTAMAWSKNSRNVVLPH